MLLWYADFFWEHLGNSKYRQRRSLSFSYLAKDRSPPKEQSCQESVPRESHQPEKINCITGEKPGSGHGPTGSVTGCHLFFWGLVIFLQIHSLLSCLHHSCIHPHPPSSLGRRAEASVDLRFGVVTFLFCGIPVYVTKLSIFSCSVVSLLSVYS